MVKNVIVIKYPILKWTNYDSITYTVYKTLLVFKPIIFLFIYLYFYLRRLRFLLFKNRLLLSANNPFLGATSTVNFGYTEVFAHLAMSFFRLLQGFAILFFIKSRQTSMYFSCFTSSRLRMPTGKERQTNFIYVLRGKRKFQD